MLPSASTGMSFTPLGRSAYTSSQLGSTISPPPPAPLPATAAIPAPPVMTASVPPSAGLVPPLLVLPPLFVVPQLLVLPPPSSPPAFVPAVGLPGLSLSSSPQPTA